jgi:hypothetical protein
MEMPFADNMILIEKNSLNPAIETGFDAWWDQNRHINRAIVVGDCTDLCVYQLAMHLRMRANALNLRDFEVIVAENVGDEYTVQQQDPAEISRTATVELDPTPAEWIKYSESIGVDQSLIEFIRQNEQFLEHKGVFEPMKKYPDRRAWVRMDQQLREGNFYEHPENHIFYVIATSMVGVEAGIKFTNFCKTRDRQVSAEEILRDWDKAKKKLGNATVNRLGECGQKVVSYLTKPDSKTKKDREISDDEIVQLSLFLKDLPGELFMTYYMPIVNRRDLVLKLQPLCKEHLLTVTRPGKKVTESK